MPELNKNLIGIFGGSFDPPHKGHLKIGLESIKRLKLKKLFWIITRKNPFKNKALFSLKERINECKKITNKKKKIKVRYLEDKIKSSKTIDVINYLIKKNKNSQFFLILGSDNLISFSKWRKWKDIINLCKLVVFSRKGFDKKAKKSAISRYLNKKNTIYIKDSKVDISSTKIRKSYFKKN
jgi:nicotinate-nucleotide adenylyltransferase